MTTYYVSKSGSDSGNGTSGSPWKTISKAMKANLKPGDEVVVRSGVYKESVTINKDGRAGDYITIRSEVPGGAKIEVPSNKSFGINVNANYVKIDGFEVSGSPRSGIVGNYVHHVEISNNISHDNKSGGIYLAKSDFLTVDGNVVYNNASSTVVSGISIHLAQNVTGSNASGFRIIVRDNVAYNNVTRNAAHTDGNGIIIDDFKATKDNARGLSPYKFPTLVEGNITYGNGSSGISVFQSDYVTVRSNIAYHNNTDLQSSGNWRGELQNTSSNHTTWTDNIAVTDLSIHRYNTAIANVSLNGSRNTDVTWKDNVTWNGKAGDPSIRTSGSNTAPSAKDNDLGEDPHLTLSKVKSMAASLTGGSSSASADADADAGASVTADADVGTSATDKSGGWGNDKLDGGAGNDKLDGHGGHDQLFGKGGSDTLDGGTGSDKLFGGTGKDHLTGGGGGDDFVFRSIAEAGKSGQRDVIHDFSHAQGDDIDLSGIDANARASGNQAFSFIGSDGFSGKAGQLKYENGIVAGDVNGDKVADFHIEIANHAALHANDFIL